MRANTQAGNAWDFPWVGAEEETAAVLLLQILYIISAAGLAVVGFNTLVLSVLYLAHRRAAVPTPPVPGEDAWPAVVIQLPVYNERHVAARVIDAAAHLDYPRDRLTIQLLDDSDDETSAIAAAAARSAQSGGTTIVHVRRSHRAGFKAGALEAGLALTDAPYVAVLDADFVPEPGFLKRVMAFFLADNRLGMVQTRWAHLNAQQNWLTRAQALALDAHFVVEQTARNRSGLLMNFSGTAGVWRRACIVDSGGWQADTLSEDIDLSYRAQLRGWRFLYLPEVGVPSEIPPLMMGFKRQQARWATGTIQCLRKLGSTLLRSGLSPWQKAQGLIHLGGYFLHPLMLIVLALTLPLLATGSLSELPLAGLGLAILGTPVQAIISQRYLYPDWKRRLVYFPVFMIMGIGITVSNTAAVIRGLRGRSHSFQRTPKFSAQGQDRAWLGSQYALPPDPTTGYEIGLAAYSAALAVLALVRLPALAPFMLVYAAGFAWVAGLSLWQSHQAKAAQRRRSTGGPESLPTTPG
jgi:cellulose synthase/poly-beta-1,6-N-acetylglucosamine synthase-like glycosyltransferase